jgi:hypothetical protein
MTTTIIILALIYHFFFDWYLQSRQDAKLKSCSDRILFKHGFIIFIGAVLLFCATHVSLIIAILLSALYTSLHLVQDWYIYKGLESMPDIPVEDYKPLWDRIALDQFLHLSILFIMLNWVV